MTGQETAAGADTQGLAWFTGAGLGIFIHWDHIAQQEVEISWPIVGRSIGRDADGSPRYMSVEQYHSTASSFDPQQWDATQVAALIASAGARYAVLTARHHDGYCMYPSAVSDFGVAATALGRDIVGEFVEATRAAGLRVGLYYSLPDCHHSDYPAFTDADRPYRRERWPREDWDDYDPGVERLRRSSPEAWSRYLDYVREQLTELLTSYGTIDLLWFDGEWERSPEEWDTDGLHALIRSLQPDIVINDRLLGHGDYQTPEQGLPAELSDTPWELCLTIGEQWAYRSDEPRVKSARSLVAQLSEVVSRGGNLLLNISPDANGVVPDWQRERLEAIGDWLARHGAAVLTAGPAPQIRHYGPVTAGESTIYLHLVYLPVEELVVRGVPVDRVSSVRLMMTGEPLAYRTGGDAYEVAGVERLGDLTIAAPAPSGSLIDVIAVELEPR
ncbi:MAG TPA: alpha-L-fucosidase [Microlunatus sp.]|nr:alpha-L-fucosidase [Microlunatus sp.]